MPIPRDGRNIIIINLLYLNQCLYRFNRNVMILIKTRKNNNCNIILNDNN